MKLSIIIVNYNVRHFLEQCLYSVEKAISGIEADVWVVDNASVDDSMEMVREKFPWVQCIDNAENVGFAKANNQAAIASNSEYVLLLNPDTILPEDNLKKVLAYMDSHPKCGASGVRMYDGAGTFLPESKRGLPTPWVAFYKIFGLSSIFPKSEKFARYHLGHLDPNENQRVEILAGAYMMMRRDAWNKAGMLDETYFMYGEDIDLSYSIEKAGYEVHYLANAPIIHYKGESTKKGSLNYVFIFYNAMLIFAKKHLSKGYASAFSLLIRMAIYLRAALSIGKRIVSRLALPVLDILVFTGGMQFIIKYWEHNHRFIEGGSYPDFYKWGITPIYALLWVIGLILAGGYRKPIKLNRILSGLILGTSFIFILYALSPDEFRFSRALIIMGSAWMTFAVLTLRFAISFVPGSQTGLWSTDQRRVGFVGFEKNANGVKALLSSDERPLSTFDILELKNLQSECYALDINELILDSTALSYSQITAIFTEYGRQKIRFQIAYPEEGWMIGSNSIHTRGQALGKKSFALSEAKVLRNKRTFDILVCLFLWTLSPIAIWAPRLRVLWWQTFSVLLGMKTWVGYANPLPSLPNIKKGVIPIKNLQDKDLQMKADNAYASTADINVDARALIRFLRKG
ncbi:MAG: glycosyltransferase [Bacteroidetes bacterium]|nr:MAG: glycosyltransferase [Bacteroidota bacterium]